MGGVLYDIAFRALSPNQKLDKPAARWPSGLHRQGDSSLYFRTVARLDLNACRSRRFLKLFY
jgi:hypothetical protein